MKNHPAIFIILILLTGLLGWYEGHNDTFGATHSRSWAGLGEAYSDAGAWNSSRFCFQYAVELHNWHRENLAHKKEAKCTYNIGVTWLKHGNICKGLEYYKKALQMWNHPGFHGHIQSDMLKLNTFYPEEFRKCSEMLGIVSR